MLVFFHVFNRTSLMAKLNDVCVCVCFFVCVCDALGVLSRYAKLGSIVIRFVCCLFRFIKEQNVSGPNFWVKILTFSDNFISNWHQDFTHKSSLIIISSIPYSMLLNFTKNFSVIVPFVCVVEMSSISNLQSL